MQTKYSCKDQFTYITDMKPYVGQQHNQKGIEKSKLEKSKGDFGTDDNWSKYKRKVGDRKADLHRNEISCDVLDFLVISCILDNSSTFARKSRRNS